MKDSVVAASRELNQLCVEISFIYIANLYPNIYIWGRGGGLFLSNLIPCASNVLIQQQLMPTPYNIGWDVGASLGLPRMVLVNF